MVQWQEAQRSQIITRRKAGHTGDHIAENVPVREHYAFGRAGGAGSIDDGSKIFVLDGILRSLYAGEVGGIGKAEQFRPVAAGGNFFNGKNELKRGHSSL